MEYVQLLEKIIKRLDLIISLELDRNGGPDGMRVADKISALKERGLSAAEIAGVVSKPLNYVTSTISQRNKIKAKVGKR